MRVVSWNVNSIRARAQRVEAWLRTYEPDIIALQETKCDDATFEIFGDRLETLGYDYAHAGRDQWNGVAIASRVGLAEVTVGFAGTNRAPYDEARLIAATCADVRVHSVYVPNGRELDDPHYLFKLVWLERLRSAIDPARSTIVIGDFNVAPADIDIYDPSRFRRSTHASPAERTAIEALCDLGLVDLARAELGETGDSYTFWNYRPGQYERNRGLRIDLALATHDIAARSRRVWVDTDERHPNAHASEKPSDHAPVVVDLA